MRRTTAIAAAALGLLVGACGPAGKTTRAGGGAVAAGPTAPADGLGEFNWPRVDVGEEVALRAAPVGVRGLAVVITFVKLSKLEYEEPGRASSVEYSADLVVEKAGEMKRVRITAGESKVILGARIKVVSASEEYDEGMLDYVPKATIVVSAP